MSIAILVVDDFQTGLETLENGLKDFGFQVYTASNGEEALEVLEKHKEIILVISDVEMPVMTGLELKNVMQRDYVGLPLILMSGSSRNQEELAYAEFIAKPFKTTCLIQKIKEVLNIS